MTNTKLTIAVGVVTAALFVLVPNAVSKKASLSSQGLSPQCSSVGGADVCTLTVAGCGTGTGDGTGDGDGAGPAKLAIQAARSAGEPLNASLSTPQTLSLIHI